MSVVITRNPPEFQPSKSDGLYFTVSADTTNEPKFRYVFEVYVQNYKVFEGKSTPNPFGLGIIDISRVLDSYLQNYPVSYYDELPIFTHQTGPFSRPYGNDVVDYYILVGEEYADSFVSPLTGFTGVGNQVGFPSVPSNTYKAFLGTMGVNRNANLPQFDIGKFTLSGTPTPEFPFTTNNLFLTNSPRIRDISVAEYYTLSFTNGNLGGQYISQPYYVEYKFYDSDGLLIRTDQYANILENGGGPASACTQDYVNTTFTGQSDYNILNVGAGPKNIYDFPNDTEYYTIQMFGGAEVIVPTPSPTPTPTKTPNLTPSVTPSLTASPTRTPSPTPSACSCINWRITSNVGFTIQIFFVNCSGISSSFFLSPYQEFYQCACSVTSNPLVTITNFGSCGVSETPTPTPTISVTPTNTPTPGLSPTPTPSFSPTPSQTLQVQQNVIVRDCCSSQIELQVVVGANLFIGNTIVISGDCYQIYAIGGDGSDGNYITAEDYINCNECVADYPCPFDPDKPNILKPSVQPTNFTPTGGTQPCVSYSAVSEIFQFNVVPVCNQFFNEQIMFKNRYGVYDYFMFEKAKAEGLSIERQTYGQWNVAWGSDNPIKTNYSRGTTDFTTDIQETHIYNSGFISQPLMVWLEELYTTNDAYLIQSNGTLFPINIVGAEFVRKTKGNKSMFNMELTISYSNNIKLLNN